jgi:hypothetical protein
MDGTSTTGDGSGHTLLVVGDGEVTTALESIARALGWRVELASSLEATTAALEL